jgi:hypothetical protein
LYLLADPLFDDFLRLTDTHGSFGECLVALAALQAKTRATLPCGDQARLASAPDATSAAAPSRAKPPRPRLSPLTSSPRSRPSSRRSPTDRILILASGALEPRLAGAGVWMGAEERDA